MAPKDSEKYNAWKKKLSDAAKKRYSQNNGKTRVEMFGEEKTQKWVEKFRNTRKNDKSEWNQKIGNSNRGKLKGKTLEQIHGEKKASEIRKKLNGKSKNKGKKSPFKGKTLNEMHGDIKSLEIKKKISDARKNLISLMTQEEKERNFKNWIDSLIKSSKKNHDTKPELKFESLLVEKGLKIHIDYEKQYRVGYYSADFYLIKENLIVEIYGCYPHQCELCAHVNGAYGKTFSKIKEKDINRINYIKSKGYNIKIIWQHQICF